MKLPAGCPAAVPLKPGQSVTAGVKRLGAVNSSTAAAASDVSVAIMDTGDSPAAWQAQVLDCHDGPLQPRSSRERCMGAGQDSGRKAQERPARELI